MFKQIYALARQLLTLMQDVQKLKAEQKEFRQELRALIDIVVSSFSSGTESVWLRNSCCSDWHRRRLL